MKFCANNFFIPSFLVCGLILVAPFDSPAQDIESILERYYEALGGKDKLEEVMAIQVESAYYSPQNLLTAHNVKYYEYPFYRLEFTSLMGSGKTIHDGKNYVEYFSSGRTYVNSKGETEKYIQRAFFLDWPWFIMKAEKTVSGKEFIGNEQFNFVIFKQGEFLMKGYFSLHSGLLEYMRIGPDFTTNLHRFMDYTDVGEIRLPFKSEGYVNNELSERKKVLSITLNPEIDRMLFVHGNE